LLSYGYGYEVRREGLGDQKTCSRHALVCVMAL
jgi:hypothetical protein